jgi:predicted porin
MTKTLLNRCMGGASIIALAGVVAVTALPAQAQDGAEVEELRREMQEMRDNMQRMEQRLRDAQDMEQRLEAVESREAPSVLSGNDNVSLSVSGQINRGLLVVDDGEDSDYFNVDTDNSGSRVRFVGKARMNEDLTVGTTLEVENQPNASNSVNLQDEVDPDLDGFGTRKVELYFESKTFGKLSLGQGDTASNGSSEVDLSGTTVATYSGANGFTLSGSLLDNGTSDAALRYGSTIGGFKVQGAVAYANGSGDDRFNFEQYNGSASVLAPFGLNLTVAGGVRDRDDVSGDDENFIFTKLGYMFDPFTIGSTAMSVDYFRGKNFNTEESDSDAYSIALVQNIDAIATEIYAMGRRFEFDDAGPNLDDIHLGLVGARVKF